MLLQLEDVHKALGGNPIIKGVSLEIRRGEVVTLLGPNGAGKTTLISMMTGLRSPDRGAVRVLGQSARSIEARSHYSVSPQDCDFPKSLTVKEVLDFVLCHHQQPYEKEELIEIFELQNLLKRQTGGLSGGQKRRLSLACAFSSYADLIFLDEPSAGLDIDLRKKLWSLIQQYKKQNKTIILTTHYLEEAEVLSNRVIVLEKGNVHFDGPLEKLQDKVARRKVMFKLKSKLQNADPVPKSLYFKQIIDQNGEHIYLTNNSDLIVQSLYETGASFEDLKILPVTLEEAFRKLLEDS